MHRTAIVPDSTMTPHVCNTLQGNISGNFLSILEKRAQLLKVGDISRLKMQIYRNKAYITQLLGAPHTSKDISYLSMSLQQDADLSQDAVTCFYDTCEEFARQIGNLFPKHEITVH